MHTKTRPVSSSPYTLHEASVPLPPAPKRTCSDRPVVPCFGGSMVRYGVEIEVPIPSPRRVERPESSIVDYYKLPDGSMTATDFAPVVAKDLLVGVKLPDEWASMGKSQRQAWCAANLVWEDLSVRARLEIMRQRAAPGGRYWGQVFRRTEKAPRTWAGWLRAEGDEIFEVVSSKSQGVATSMAELDEVLGSFDASFGEQGMHVHVTFSPIISSKDARQFARFVQHIELCLMIDSILQGRGTGSRWLVPRSAEEQEDLVAFLQGQGPGLKTCMIGTRDCMYFVNGNYNGSLIGLEIRTSFAPQEKETERDTLQSMAQLLTDALGGGAFRDEGFLELGAVAVRSATLRQEFVERCKALGLPERMGWSNEKVQRLSGLRNEARFEGAELRPCLGLLLGDWAGFPLLRDSVDIEALRRDALEEVLRAFALYDARGGADRMAANQLGRSLLTAVRNFLLEAVGAATALRRHIDDLAARMARTRQTRGDAERSLLDCLRTRQFDAATAMREALPMSEDGWTYFGFHALGARDVEMLRWVCAHIPSQHFIAVLSRLLEQFSQCAARGTFLRHHPDVEASRRSYMRAFGDPPDNVELAKWRRDIGATAHPREISFGLRALIALQEACQGDGLLSSDRALHKAWGNLREPLKDIVVHKARAKAEEHSRLLVSFLEVGEALGVPSGVLETTRQQLAQRFEAALSVDSPASPAACAPLRRAHGAVKTNAPLFRELVDALSRTIPGQGSAQLL